MASKKKNNETSKEEILTLTHLTTKELKKIKYTEIRQAYNLFVSALKFEPENLRDKEHFRSTLYTDVCAQTCGFWG